MQVSRAKTRTTSAMNILIRMMLTFLLFGLAFGDNESQDSASIQGCQDPVLNVIVQRGSSSDTLTLIVNDTWRGSYPEGKILRAIWGSDNPVLGTQWIVMGNIQEDGYFHVHPQVRYPFGLEKAEWVQDILKK